jgi:hypothetical protein
VLLRVMLVRRVRLAPPSVRVNSRQTAEWAQRGGGWFGRVVYAVDDGGRVVLVEAWVPAEHLEPAAR